MKKEKLSVGKKVLIIVIAVISLGCLALDGWFIWIKLAAPEKVISNTYIVGEQTVSKVDSTTGEVVEETRPAIEVNVFNNAFEIKINEMMTEEQTEFHSKGVQYISKDDSAPNFRVDKDAKDLLVDATNYSYPKLKKKEQPYLETTNTLQVLFWNVTTGQYEHYNNHYQVAAKGFNSLNFYEYQETANTGFVANYTDTINEDTFFKIQIGDELYLMKPKYFNTPIDEEKNFLYEYISPGKIKDSWKTSTLEFYHSWYYRVYDFHYISEMIYKTAASVAPGTSKDIVLKFGDYFDYFEYSGNYNYTQITQTEIKDKLTNYVNNYYVVRVNSFDYNLDSSEKSMFGYYRGQQNTSEEDVEDSVLDYTLSKTIYNLSVSDFEFVSTSISGEYIFKLREDVLSKIYVKTDTIMFNINLNLAEFNIKLAGIDKASLGGIEVYKAVVTENINGTPTERQVQYV